MMKKRLLLLTVSCWLFSQLAQAQNAKTFTTADYERATSRLWGNTSQLMDNYIRPQWSPDGKVWYRSLANNTKKYKLYNPANKKKASFNTRKELLGKIAKSKYQRPTVSPDGKYTVFIRDWNLWMKNNATGKEQALTTDGVKDFGYATDNAGWLHSKRAIVHWSPDSKKIATYQQDQRHISDMYLVKTKVGAPKLMSWKYPLPGDKSIIKIHRVIIDISKTPKVIRLKMKPDDRRSTLWDDIASGGKMIDVAWSHNSQRLAFVSSTRDHKQANLRMADATTGQVKDILEEKVATQFESGQDDICWRYLSESNEIIWYSERSDWGHLYLYDATTGALKNKITTGAYVVRHLLRVDQKKRQIYFVAGGKEANNNPYYRYAYRVGFNGKGLKLLTPGKGDHSVQFSPDGKYFIDSYSQPNVPPVYEVRNAKGKLMTTLEKTDISALTATGWKAPAPFKVKSADKKWDLYGLLFTPNKMEAGKKYPVIVYIYPGPQGGSVGGWGFYPAKGDCQALTELGFVVVRLEGSCNPNRSKSFHDACYGNMDENTLPDQIAGLKQLAAKHNFIDLNKVGIWGHSGGGFATAAALLRYPDFFKVGISESGNHDNRNYEDDWGERYIGLEKNGESGVSNYAQQANQKYAKNLKGKLMIIHGGMDDNVPPYNSYLLADALMKANKDYDFILLPHARHGFGRDRNYIMRRRWDYFVRHLLKATPPKEFKVKISRDPRLK